MYIKIIVTGPESCGKTTLVEQLVKHYKGAIKVPEFSRFYLTQKMRNSKTPQVPPQYSIEELEMMARGQVDIESLPARIFRSINSQGTVICDTDLLTYKIWAEEVFGTLPEFIYSHIHFDKLYFESMRGHKYRFYLLCSPEGIAWEPDPLRQNPLDRERLFDLYEKELKELQLTYTVLKGNKEERLEKAVQAIETMIKYRND